MIDAHQHFWHYDPVRLDWIEPDMVELKQDWLPPHLAPCLNAAHLDKTIAVQATGDDAETQFLLQLAAQYDWIAGVVGWTDLRAAEVTRHLTHWQQAGALVGIRHQIEGEPVCLDDAAFDTGVRAVQQRELVYEILVNYRQLDHAVPFCARHDRHTLVLDHLAKPPVTGDATAFTYWYKAMADLASMPHVAVKMSGLVTEAQAVPGGTLNMDGIRRYLDAALELFGEDRVLYGSDWPVCRLATGYADWFAFIQTWARGKQRSLPRKLFGANAAAIYALNK